MTINLNLLDKKIEKYIAWEGNYSIPVPRKMYFWMNISKKNQIPPIVLDNVKDVKNSMVENFYLSFY